MLDGHPPLVERAPGILGLGVLAVDPGEELLRLLVLLQRLVDQPIPVREHLAHRRVEDLFLHDRVHGEILYDVLGYVALLVDVARRPSPVARIHHPEHCSTSR